uniref:methylmalonate-semialdehyde dehydrogenase (CoA acylating) n=2 Tax=Rhodosorus marinus TaxID=101924 RepID=A0A7S2ZUA9_9RHOD|mmetsp:Transcript_31162/g.119884  ORF Transcript_31162/g.119884 Transcript_31162/m.119884 type:complete len:516 (+) Transcript_31162:1685-3232(+)
MKTGQISRVATAVSQSVRMQRAPILSNFVGGKFVESSASDYFYATNPGTGEKSVGTPEDSTDAEIDIAVKTAAEAFPSWSRTPVSKRVNIMFRLKEAVTNDLDNLAGLVRKELGKTPADARGDVLRGLEVLEYSCGVASQLTGSSLPNFGTNIDVTQRREPLGVCLGIAPFNFPAMIPLWMFPLAIACGNTFILKPSELVPSASSRLAELSLDAGVPPGVFNIVHGRRRTVESLISRDEIKAVSFVGSTEVGTSVYTSATARGKRAQCNLGAKNHAVVMPDADPMQAAKQIVGAAFGASGQRCMALSTVVLVGEAAKVLDNLVDGAESLKVGIDDNADMGPVVTPRAKDRIEKLIQSGRAQGASIVLDGTKREHPERGGNFIYPTIIDDVKPDMEVYKQEIFGPVLVCLRAKTLEDALDLVNSNPYGNGAAIFTSSGSNARKFESEVKSGQVGINVPIPLGPPQMGFTGSAGSMLGDLPFYGQSGVQFFTKPKNVVSRWVDQDPSLSSTVIPVSR